MFKIQILTNILLFIIGSFGILLNRRSILVVLMSIELILLSVNLNFILFSVYLDDFIGQLFSLFILVVAAAETSIGLAIVIMCHRSIKMKVLSVDSAALLKG
jgi:NADH-quinone oxidoreductase subunit K